MRSQERHEAMLRDQRQRDLRRFEREQYGGVVGVIRRRGGIRSTYSASTGARRR